MEVTLHDLIESIKKDGVETAEKRADEIQAAAENRATEIVDAARAKADSIVAEAEQNAAMKEQSSIASIRQASRDLLIALRKSIIAIFDEVIEKQAGKALADPKLMAELIAAAVKADLLAGESGVFEIDEKLSRKVSEQLKAELAAELLAKNEIKPVKGIQGFKLADTGGNGYFRISPKVLADMIGSHLNPELRELIIAAAESGE